MSGQIPPVGVPPPAEGAPPLLPPPQTTAPHHVPNTALAATPPGLPRIPPPFQTPPGGMLPPGPMGVPPMGLPPPVVGGVPQPMPGFPPRVPVAPILNGPPRWQPPRVPVQPPIALPVISAAPVLTANEQLGDVFVSTVFVGNISDRASDGLVRQILMKCGKMNSWKRVQGTAGKLQAFGFCEYANPESTLRALRLLHGLSLGSKSLTVKVDSKSRKDLTKYIIRKKKVKEGLSREEAAKAAEEEAEKSSSEDTSGALEEELDEDTVAADVQVKEALVTMVKENASSFAGDDDSDLKHNVTEAMISMARQTGKIGPDENTTDIDENVRDRVSDEIKRFRENYKKSEDLRMKEIQKQQSKDTHVDKSEKSKEREKEDKEKDRDRGRERDRDRDRDREARSKRSRSRSRHRASRSRSRERRRSRSPVKREKRERDWEEEMEERRLEKRKRERQDAYEERLKNWEMRERRKAKESRRRMEREEMKKEDLERNKKKADRMMADYDDDEDDYRYYKNNALADRLRDRELEVEEDEKDKLRERDEVEKSTPRSEEEEEMDAGGDQQWAREAQPPATQLYAKNFESDEKKEVEGEGEPQLLVQQKPIPLLKEEPPPVINAAFHSEYHLAEEDSKPKVAFEIGGRAPTGSGESSSGGGVKRIASGVFGTDEEQEEGPKKKPLTRPSAVEEQAAPPPVVKEYSAEERKKVMKTLVDSIPTSKGDLFAYQIKWDFLDSVLIEKRIGPWINKKIMEYIGEEEPALTEFIINNLKQHCTPRALLDEISMILDDEGEVFVVKLWRLLIYETEAKVLGISKVV